MGYGSMILLSIVINSCHKFDSKLILIPRNTEVKINDSTYMNCSTSLQADKVQWRHGNKYVFAGISLLEPYNHGRFSVEINASTGASNLVIRSVQPSDAGTYECTDDEGSGEKRSAQLIVLYNDPFCKSTMPSDGVIGPNSCNIEPEEVEFLCSVKYYGNNPPALQWKMSGYNQSVADGLLNITYRYSTEEVFYTLTLKSTIDLINSTFVCQTTRTSDKHYSCSSDTINILYVFSSEVTVNMTVDDEVNCFANTSQSCSYKWKWFSGDDSITESDDQNLTPKKVGWHRCEATCLFGNRSCTVEVMYAEVSSSDVKSVGLHAEVISDEVASSSNNMLILLLVLIVVPAAVVIGVVKYLKAKKRKSACDAEDLEMQEQSLFDGLPEKYKSELVCVDTIQTEPAKDSKKSIFGLTILDNELFAVSERSSEVEVYDSTNFTFNRRWNLKDLVDPWDIASCSRNKCIYIFDFKGCHKKNEILRVDPLGNIIKKWFTGCDSGWGLSVTDKSNVILTVSDRNIFTEYSPDGKLIREINLPLDKGIHRPWHVVKLTNGRYVVSHGDNADDLHGVCVVSADGKLKSSFGGKCGSNMGQMNEPFHLFVNGDGFVLVVDRKNGRILLLGSDLKFKRVILSKEKHGLRQPWRILLDESTGRMFVADNEWGSGGRILIFKSCERHLNKT